MRTVTTALLVLTCLAASFALAAEPGLLLRVRMPAGVPAASAVPVWADAAAADLRAAGLDLRQPLQATEIVDGQLRLLAAQADRTPDGALKLCVLLPGEPAGQRLIKLNWGAGGPPPPPNLTLRVSQEDGKLVIHNRDYTLVHDPAKQGGQPSRLVFGATGKVLESMRWQERLHHREALP